MISAINGYRSPYMYSVSDDNVRTQNEKAQENKVSDVKEEAVSLAQDNSGRADRAPVKSDNSSLMDSFRGGKDLNIFGSNSRFNEIEHAEKALMDMKKDDILDRYTYFVNPTSTGLGTDADGTVRLKTSINN